MFSYVQVRICLLTEVNSSLSLVVRSCDLLQFTQKEDIFRVNLRISTLFVERTRVISSAFDQILYTQEHFDLCVLHA